MKKICPPLVFCFIFIVSVLGVSFARPQVVFADPAIPVINVSPAPDGNIVPDADVNFAGKTAARAADFVDWNLKNYAWAQTGSDSYLSGYWAQVRNVVYAMLLIVILSAAFVIIISHGTNLTVWKFINRFILILILVTFSFALLQILYQLTDVVQGFFVHNPSGAPISKADLLAVPDYKTFVGSRIAGMAYDESAFITINLVKITAITYYVMGGILLVRKVILWFFIIISPIFPLLILYVPLRNTAKIWIGELFRWLLYAPLFMLFLSGLLVLWKSKIGILPFDFIANPGTLSTKVYPNATNILLAGPGVSPAVNSINNNNTFIQYIVALIMLWAVILLPFLLLRIFLDYVVTLSVEDEHFSYLKGKLSWVNNVMRGNISQPGSSQTRTNENPMPSAGFAQRMTSFIKNPQIILNGNNANPTSTKTNPGSKSESFLHNQASQHSPHSNPIDKSFHDTSLKTAPEIKVHLDKTGERSNVNSIPMHSIKLPNEDNNESHIVAPPSTLHAISINTGDEKGQSNPLEEIERNKNVSSTSIGAEITGVTNANTKIHGVADKPGETKIDGSADISPQSGPQSNYPKASTAADLEEKSGMHENMADIIE